MTQTTLTQNPEHGQSGQLYYPPPNGGVRTGFAEGSVAAGLAVVAGTDEGDVAVPTAAFDSDFKGIVLYKDTHATNVWADEEQLAFCREGFVLVAYEPDTDPTPDTQVHARHTANGAGKLTLGAIRANVDTDNADPVPGAMFRKVFASEKKVLIELSGHVL